MFAHRYILQRTVIYYTTTTGMTGRRYTLREVSQRMHVHKVEHERDNDGKHGEVDLVVEDSEVPVPLEFGLLLHYALQQHRLVKVRADAFLCGQQVRRVLRETKKNG